LLTFVVGSFSIGAGIGVFAGMAGGPIGMLIGCAIGVPLFGFLGVCLLPIKAAHKELKKKFI